jgi:hypothetical protein
MARGIKTEWVILGFIVLILLVVYLSGGFKIPQAAVQPTGEGGAPPGYATSIKVSGYDPINAVLTNVNAELWSSDNTQIVGETQANAALTTLTSNGANTFSGYIMIGKIWM